MNQSLNANRNTGKILMYAALVLGAVLMIFPFVWMLLTSFKSAGESVQIPPTILPRQWLTDNYRRGADQPALPSPVRQHHPVDPLSRNLCGGLFLRRWVCLCQTAL